MGASGKDMNVPIESASVSTVTTGLSCLVFEIRMTDRDDSKQCIFGPYKTGQPTIIPKSVDLRCSSLAFDDESNGIGDSLWRVGDASR